MIDKIREIRVKLDGYMQLTSALTPYENKGDGLLERLYANVKTEQIDKAIVSLQLSKMWMGKVLGELGESTPYPESKDHTNETIAAVSDKSRIDITGYFPVSTPDMPLPHVYKDLSHIQKVKWLRAQLSVVENDIRQLYNDLISFDDSFGEHDLHFTYEAMRYCIEAAMWLGMELGRIKDHE